MLFLYVGASAEHSNPDVLMKHLNTSADTSSDAWALESEAKAKEGKLGVYAV